MGVANRVFKMKVLIAVDIEGISGIANSREYNEFTFGREWMTADTNASIQGAIDGGADVISVCESHGRYHDNIVLDQLHPKARIIRGGKNMPFYILEGITEDTDLVFLIGCHDKIGGPGVLSHTFTNRQINRMRINGIEVGEVEIAAGLAVEFGVPVGLVTGNDITCENAKEFLGFIEIVCVKRAIDRYAAECLPFNETGPLIQKGAKRPVRRVSELKPYRFKAPYSLEWDCNDHHIATMIERVPGTELLRNNTVRYTSESFKEMFNMLITWRTILRADSEPY